MFDTIVAPITGVPPAGVAWIRLSGADAWEVAAKVFAPWPVEVVARTAYYGRWESGDDGYAVPFTAESFTGETSVEISLHGSRASIAAALAACQAAGARLARPGEFSERAFLNGKIDLTQAEGIRQTIDAETAAQLRLANANRTGKLRSRIGLAQEKVLAILASVEASVDFSEEIGEFDRQVGRDLIGTAESILQDLLKSAHIGRIARDGYWIALVGRPNVGKSSLLNRILGTERAIVTEHAGTTRDLIEEAVDVGGTKIVFVDTAGLRDAEDPVERIGVERSREALANADEAWLIVDARLGPTPEDEELARSLNREFRWVRNKADLLDVPPEGAVSAKTGDGIPELLALITEKVGVEGYAVAVNERQAELLAEALSVADQIESALDAPVPDDLISVHLREMLQILGRITGETAEVEMIDRIFRDFCIGK